MKKQIFISSTYIDLVSHRESIWELLQSFNVSISGMEKFGARTEVPLETCIKEVEGSDIYIGIIGMRYGSIEKESKKSFSQLEYEKAKKLGKEILIFIIDEDNSKINPKHIDFENYESLRNFKSILKTNHTIDIFRDENDLITKLNSSLRKILEPENIKKYYRPKKIECSVQKFIVEEETWILLLGENFGKPFEIFVANLNPYFNLPDWLRRGWIIKSSSRKVFDFQFEDKQGYKITFEGISRLSKDIISSLISKLLEKEVPIDKVIEVMDELNFEKGEFENILKKIIKKALLNKTVANNS